MLPALVVTALAIASSGQQEPPSSVSKSPTELVQALRDLPAGLPGIAPSGGVLPPAERLRSELYDALWSLGPQALPALCHGLSDPQVQVRRNVALFLGVAGGDWYDRNRPRLAIAACVPALVEALGDADDRVRGLAAQAVGATGAAGAPAVPALVRMLGSADEGDRNTACLALGNIGPAAKAALPALEKALSDPSQNVQRFASRAIARINR